ncbi:MAG TPA: hypothetical protein VK678_23220, partial [Bradyrhizobium sp.]|nr:hypothetical protein [Bradyrhizobium sp.]
FILVFARIHFIYFWQTESESINWIAKSIRGVYASEFTFLSPQTRSTEAHRHERHWLCGNRKERS